MNKWTVLIVFDLDGNLSSGAYIFCIHLVLSIFYISEILHLHMDYKIRVITRENVQYLTTSLTVEKHDRRKKHLLAGWRVSPNTPVTDLMDFVMTDVQMHGDFMRAEGEICEIRRDGICGVHLYDRFCRVKLSNPRILQASSLFSVKHYVLVVRYTSKSLSRRSDMNCSSSSRRFFSRTSFSVRNCQTL